MFIHQKENEKKYLTKKEEIYDKASIWGQFHGWFLLVTSIGLYVYGLVANNTLSQSISISFIDLVLNIIVAIIMIQISSRIDQ